jgi:hypothetical protein
MMNMHYRSRFRLCFLVALIGLLFSSLAVDAQQKASGRGRKYKSPPPNSRVEVTVLREANGKPILNAAVIFHLVGDKGNMELKTNDDGKAVIDVLNIGSTVQLQVFAKGFQTYGDDFKIDGPQKSIEVRMKRPGEQYSIYKPHPAGPVGGNSPEAAKPDSESKDKPATQQSDPGKP